MSNLLDSLRHARLEDSYHEEFVNFLTAVARGSGRTIYDANAFIKMLNIYREFGKSTQSVPLEISYEEVMQFDGTSL